MSCETKLKVKMPWADGTECNAGKQCYQGKCFEREKLVEMKREKQCVRKNLKIDGNVSKKNRINGPKAKLPLEIDRFLMLQLAAGVLQIRINITRRYSLYSHLCL